MAGLALALAEFDAMVDIVGYGVCYRPVCDGRIVLNREFVEDIIRGVCLRGTDGIAFVAQISHTSILFIVGAGVPKSNFTPAYAYILH